MFLHYRLLLIPHAFFIKLRLFINSLPSLLSIYLKGDPVCKSIGLIIRKMICSLFGHFTYLFLILAVKGQGFKHLVSNLFFSCHLGNLNS